MVTRIEKSRGRCSIVVLAVLFLLIFAILLGIGSEAPNVLSEKTNLEDEDPSAGDDDAAKVFDNYFKMSKENQLFWIDIRLSVGVLSEIYDDANGSGKVVVDLDIELKVYEGGASDGEANIVATESISGSTTCDVGEEYCDYFFLWRRDFIDYDEYLVQLTIQVPEEYDPSSSVTDGDSPFEVQQKVTAINPDFTRFEIGWKYFWLVATLLLMFMPCGLGFLSTLKKRFRERGEPRTYHQRWTATLLWALVWFNDPAVALTVYTGWSKFFSALFIVSVGVFVFLLLLFWLCLLSDLRFMQHRADEISRGCCYWIPKVLLTAAIGITVFGGYIYYRFENTVSFEYTGVDDEKKRAEILAGFLGFLMAVYMLWIVVLVLRSCGKLRRTSPSFILLFVVTLLTCLVAVIGVFVAAYYPYSTSGTAFVGVHGLLNLYVWTLAISFMPVDADDTRQRTKQSEMPPVVVGTTTEDADLNAWSETRDSDFKAVEL